MSIFGFSAATGAPFGTVMPYLDAILGIDRKGFWYGDDLEARPFFIGRSGRLRSRAWIRLFISSMRRDKRWWRKAPAHERPNMRRRFSPSPEQRSNKSPVQRSLTVKS